jgi:hypothetical protein
MKMSNDNLLNISWRCYFFGRTQLKEALQKLKSHSQSSTKTKNHSKIELKHKGDTRKENVFSN